MPLDVNTLSTNLAIAMAASAVPTGSSDLAASNWASAIHGYSILAVSCSGTVVLKEFVLQEGLEEAFAPEEPHSGYVEPAENIAGAWKDYWVAGDFGSGSIELVSLLAAETALAIDLATQFTANSTNLTASFASVADGIASAIDTATRMINIQGPLPCPGKLT